MKNVFYIILPLILICQTTAVNINNCASLDVAGASYVLTADILNSSAAECLKIQADGVTLNCGGHRIEGRGLNDTYGIYVNAASGATIKNCAVEDWFYGVVSAGGDYNTFINITSVSSGKWGFIIFNGVGNTVRNMTVSDSGSFGVDLWNASKSTVDDVRSFDNRGDAHGFVVDTSANCTINNIKSHNNAQNGIYLYYSDDNGISNASAYANNYSGVTLYNSGNNTISNVTATNNIVNGFLLEASDGNVLRDVVSSHSNGTGIFIFNSGQNTIDNASSTENNVTGIYLQNSDQNTVKNSRIVMNVPAGMYMGFSRDNNIYNNLFNNTGYTLLFGEEGYPNTWNASMTAGRRISSNGARIAGNYWASPTGEGYSETCDDADKNGFCDLGYELYGGNIDYLPLSNKYEAGNTAGDANGDGKVSYSDLLILAASYGKTPGQTGYDSRADYNGDEKVNYSDLLILAANYGT